VIWISEVQAMRQAHAGYERIVSLRGSILILCFKQMRFADILLSSGEHISNHLKSVQQRYQLSHGKERKELALQHEKYYY